MLNKNITLCVILHYGSKKFTNSCVRSLIKIPNLDIVISDNDPDQLYCPLDDFKSLVKVLKTGGSKSFAEGNNIAVKKYLKKTHKYIFILNNDTIVQKDAIKFLRETINNKGVGAVGPCMPYANNRNKIWACGGYINKFKLSVGGIKPKKNKAYQVDYLPGAAIFCRSDLWKDIGGLNEKYFLAYEETEFALEIQKRGWIIMADPRSIIFHHVGISDRRDPKYFYNSVRNRLIFSKYIFGEVFGIIYGIFITLIFIRARSFSEFTLRIKLWKEAINDYFKNIPINNETLNSISYRLKK